MISLQIKLLRGDKITHGLSMTNAISTSKIVYFIICSIFVIGEF